MKSSNGTHLKHMKPHSFTKEETRQRANKINPQVDAFLSQSLVDAQRSIETLSSEQCIALTEDILYLLSNHMLSLEIIDQLSVLYKENPESLLTPQLLNQMLAQFQGTLDRYQREGILAMLFHHPQGTMLFEQLSDAERVDLSGPWIRPMMRLASVDLFPRFALLSLYHSTPKAERKRLMSHLERCRIEAKVKDLICYESLLKAQLTRQELTWLFRAIYRSGELDALEPIIDQLPVPIGMRYRAIRTALTTREEFTISKVYH